MMLPGQWRKQTHHQPLTALSGQSWNGGSPGDCGSPEEVTGQTWVLERAFWRRGL